MFLLKSAVNGFSIRNLRDFDERDLGRLSESFDFLHFRPITP